MLAPVAASRGSGRAPLSVRPTLPHRLSSGAIIGGVVAVLLLVAAAGAAVALMARGGGGPSPVPTFGPGGDATPGSGSQLIEVENLSIVVPGDWTVGMKDPFTIQITGPQGGQLNLASSLWPADAKVQVLQEAIVAEYKKLYPDTNLCREPGASSVPGGPSDGLGFALCFTETPEGGAATPSVSLLRIGVHGDWFFLYGVTAPVTFIDTFVEQVEKLPAPSWKRYKP